MDAGLIVSHNAKYPSQSIDRLVSYLFAIKTHVLEYIFRRRSRQITPFRQQADTPVACTEWRLLSLDTSSPARGFWTVVVFAGQD
jgi:hypothetical protein